MGRAKVTASILIGSNNQVDKESKSISNSLHKNFGKREIGNIHAMGDFICFDIISVCCTPNIMELYPDVQLYVNGNAVNMAMLKP